MIKRWLSLIICLVMVFSVSGVWATWVYSTGITNPESTEVSVHMKLFEFPPEEVLPGGDENDEEVQLGQNHYAVIDLILNESDKGYGLNINNNVLLHKYLRDHPYVFSNQKISGGNLKFILDERNNNHGLYYCVEKVTDTLYYAYTFTIDALSTAAGTDVEIEVYRTALEKTDLWRATVSHKGHALTRPLRDFGESASSQSLSYSIDPASWHIHED